MTSLLLMVALLADMQAGATKAFEVASVKPNRSNAGATTRFPLGPGDAYVPGGIFSAANQPLIVYLRFAFKLGQSDLADLPAWVYEERFDIEARAPSSATKDDMRLMMQSLLADRFKLVTHTQRQTRPVFNLVMVKAGRTGPQLQRHSDDGTCGSGIPCGAIGPVPASEAGRGKLAGRGVTMARLAAFLMNPFTGVDRPVVDRTGLGGTFDFSVEWALPRDPSDPPAQSDDAPTFPQALREQLGLALKSATGPVAVPAIDRLERPTPD